MFVDQYMTEGADVADLALPSGQDRLVEAVAEANPRTVVVLETGGPVLMPWLDRTAAVLEAWYPGQAGGEAIADLLTGVVDPSGPTLTKNTGPTNKITSVGWNYITRIPRCYARC